MNSKSIVSETGRVAIVEWENPFAKATHSLTIRFFVLGKEFGIYLHDAKQPVMYFPSSGCGPRRLLSRFKRNAPMHFITRYAEDEQSDECKEYVEEVMDLINKARLEMLKRAQL